MTYKSKYIEIQCNEAGAVLNKPDLVHGILKDDFDVQENMILIGLDIKNKVLIKKTIAIGGHNCVMITPKDIFTILLQHNCCNFIIAHNHPSGDLSPSPEDIIFTKKVKKATEIMGLDFLDHIIFTDKEYNSLKAGGLL